MPPPVYRRNGEDIVIPPSLVGPLVGIVPGAKLEMVPEAGHSVYIEPAERFNRVVDEWLLYGMLGAGAPCAWLRSRPRKAGEVQAVPLLLRVSCEYSSATGTKLISGSPSSAERTITECLANSGDLRG